MPLYEYACTECSKQFETLVRDDQEAAAVVCPACASKNVQRQLSLPALAKVEAGNDLPMPCNSDGPACGAPWCQRTE